MRTLSIHLGHDANACIYDSETLDFHYIKEERVSGQKHDQASNKIVRFINKLPKVDIVALSYGHLKNINEMTLYHFNSNWDEFHKVAIKDIRSLSNNFPKLIYKKFWLKKYYEILEKTNNLNIPVYCVQHDYAHILSGWTLGINYNYGISIDGCGPDNNNKLIIKNPFNLKDTETIFFSRLNITPHRNINAEEMSYKNSLGPPLSYIGRLMGLGGLNHDLAGKIMGISAYGKIRDDIVKDFDNKCVDVSKFQITQFCKDIFKKFLDVNVLLLDEDYTEKCNAKNQEFLDIIASIQHIWKKTVLLLFNKFIPKNSTVIYSGGCAQNTITNKALLKDYPNLDIVPHCYDGGLSLGCLAFVILKHNLQFPKLENFPYIQTDMSVDPPSETTIKQVAKLLAEGKIVGWYQGHGEVGPRALGNRSILMNPSIENAKDILNSKVKHREHWRPFAPSIMEEYASDWFDIEKSKYMMIAANVHEDKRKLIPAVTHKDGTSRIQTVALEDNNIFYNLLKEFYSITNIPMLLNTSLNKGGGPIVGDPSQAIDIYNDTELDALCVGDQLYVKNYELIKVNNGS